MDTTLQTGYELEKTATSTVGIVILFFLLIFQVQQIPAKETGFGAFTGLSPTLNYIKEEQAEREFIFEKEMESKYRGNYIVNVDKGVKHIRLTRYFKGKPVRINIVELSTDINENISVEPSIASDTLASRTKISDIAKRENALVAINGGYFKPQTGVPLGTLMINGKMYTGPIYDRVALGIFDEGYAMGRIKLNAVIDTNIGGLKIDNINQPRMLSTNVLVYTPDWGVYSPPCPQYGKAMAISGDKIIAQSYGQLEIPKDGFVIVGPEKKLNEFSKAKKLKLNIKTNPDWDNVNHIISGGPYLVKDSEVFVDMTAQKLASVGGRNPRTAIGYTKDNHLIMLTADGREGASIGLTLMELAYLMKELGCVNAMNLDGGGSTVMYVNGKIVNKPAVQGGIPLSHTLTITRKA